jgi:hypothetical protein
MQKQSRSITTFKPDELNPFISFLSNDGRGAEDAMSSVAAGLNALQTLYTVDDPGNLSSQTTYPIFVSCPPFSLEKKPNFLENRLIFWQKKINI